MSRAIRSRWYFTLATLLLAISVADGRQQDRSDFKPNDTQKELIQLVTDWQSDLTAWYAEMDALGERAYDPSVKAELLAKDPSARHGERMLSFEVKHRGSHDGLMAINVILRIAAGNGRVNAPAYVAKSEAVSRLTYYDQFEELPSVVRTTLMGAHDPRVELTLQRLIDSPKVSAKSKEWVRYYLATWYLSAVEMSDFFRLRMARQIDKNDHDAVLMRELDENNASVIPTDDQMVKWRAEAIEMLIELVYSSTGNQQTQLWPLDPGNVYWRLDPERNSTQPTLDSVASGLLFREMHLREGQPAPELELTLLNGESWSLSAQRGKAVLIQFSYKGCGPCERMYPDMARWQDEFKEDLVVIGIMGDENRETTEESVQNGILKWRVSWDGHRGPFATKWNVTGFPTVYLIDKQGKIACANSLREDELEEVIRRATGE